MTRSVGKRLIDQTAAAARLRARGCATSLDIVDQVEFDEVLDRKGSVDINSRLLKSVEELTGP